MSRRHVTECQVARNSQLVLHALGGPGRPTATRGTTWPMGEWNRPRRGMRWLGREALNSRWESGREAPTRVDPTAG